MLCGSIPGHVQSVSGQDIVTVATCLPSAIVTIPESKVSTCFSIYLLNYLIIFGHYLHKNECPCEVAMSIFVFYFAFLVGE